MGDWHDSWISLEFFSVAVGLNRLGAGGTEFDCEQRFLEPWSKEMDVVDSVSSKSSPINGDPSLSRSHRVSSRAAGMSSCISAPSPSGSQSLLLEPRASARRSTSSSSGCWCMIVSFFDSSIVCTIVFIKEDSTGITTGVGMGIGQGNGTGAGQLYIIIGTGT